MKKILCAIMSFIFVFAFCSCSSKTENEVPKSQTEAQPETAAKEKEEFSGWKEFVQEYEEWMDEYIAIAKKFKENPQDADVQAQHQSKLGELTEWANRTGKMQKELENAPEDVIKEYESEVTRILGKLTEAMQ